MIGIDWIAYRVNILNTNSTELILPFLQPDTQKIKGFLKFSGGKNGEIGQKMD